VSKVFLYISHNVCILWSEITEVLKFKDHLKNLVTEMDYNNISIKLLEEEFPQEDSKVKVTLEYLLARYISVDFLQNHEAHTKRRNSKTHLNLLQLKQNHANFSST
jgi:hypothetical protein